MPAYLHITSRQLHLTALTPSPEASSQPKMNHHTCSPCLPTCSMLVMKVCGPTQRGVSMM